MKLGGFSLTFTEKSPNIFSKIPIYLLRSHGKVTSENAENAESHKKDGNFAKFAD